jgi:hypothetical protein
MGNLSLRCLIRHFIGVITLIVVFSHASLAQSVFEGQVIDSALQEPLSSVTVSLLEKKLTTATNSQGYFRINSDETIVNDTLVFSSVGYLTYKVPISTFVNNSVIVLSPSNASLAQVEIRRRKLKFKRLNGFGLGQLVPDTIYVPIPYSSPIAYAKYFIAPEDNATLTKIELGRVDFEVLPIERYIFKASLEPTKPITKPEIDLGYTKLEITAIEKYNPVPQQPIKPLTKSNPRARFNVKVFSVHEKTKLPDKILFTKSLSLENNLTWVTLDLTTDSLALKSKEFFVAVEWIRIPYNEIMKLEWAPRVRTTTKNGKQKLEDVSQYRVLYQPALASFGSSKNIPSYIRDDQGNWVPSLYNKEVAISATIKY